MKPLRTSRYKLTAGLNRLSRHLSFLSVRAEPEEQQTTEAVPRTELPFRETAAHAIIERPHVPEEFPKRTAPLLF